MYIYIYILCALCTHYTQLYIWRFPMVSQKAQLIQVMDSHGLGELWPLGISHDSRNPHVDTSWKSIMTIQNVPFAAMIFRGRNLHLVWRFSSHI